MKSLKPLQWVGVTLGLLVILYVLYSHMQSFGNISFLGELLGLEIIIASLWKYDQRFFVLLMATFILASLQVPMKSAGTIGRWFVLGAGAIVGFIVWSKTPRNSSGTLHLVAFFCVCTAFVSATVSQYTKMASLKALSLLLLFLYCSTGARMAVIGREDRFFRGLLIGVQVVVYVTAICYFGLGVSVWGNPNSIGASMSIGCFPILLWGWLIAEGPAEKFRRLVALLLCTYLVFFSMARAGMVSITLVTLIFCICLHQYKLLVKVVALILITIAITGMLAPATLNARLEAMKDAVLYKGHKEEGFLGSRRTPWETTVASIKEHPLFGTGYGTSPTGEDPGFDFGTVASSAETAREHGSSYMTILEWVGLLGVVPFVAILAVSAYNVWKACVWMSRTHDPRGYSVPLAMVVFSGLIHANFEDWLFAVGSYPCVYFWVCAFLLADLIPGAVTAPVPGVVSRVARPVPVVLDAPIPYR
jgi:O-antigen ligase